VQTSPILKDLVLVGGGHSHIEVLRRFAMRPLLGARLTLVSEHATSPYSGMLPGFVAGHYEADEIHIDLRRLALVAGARFVRATVTGIDPDAQALEIENRPNLTYDLLSLNIGSVPDIGSFPGGSMHVLPVKPIDEFLKRWSDALVSDRPLTIGVVGGGAAGVEMVLALQQRLGRNFGHCFNLFEARPEILPSLNIVARRKIRQSLSRAGVIAYTGRRIKTATGSGIVFEDGAEFSLDITVWATGASAPTWLKETQLAINQKGFVRVDRHLRSTSHMTVFAAGDIAAIDGLDLPRAGVHAVRQGVVLAENLRRALTHQPTRPFRPQRHFLNLIATGAKHGVASRGMFHASGNWVWRWKDKIDRRFMGRYGDLPMMRDGVVGQRLPELNQLSPDELMHCRGCGAKLGPNALSQALARVSTASPAVDLSTMDDAAVLTPPAGQTLLQSVDFFPALLSDPWLFGKIAANHCLGDLHAMSARPWTALALAQLHRGSETVKSEDLFQMLAGAAEVFEAEGVKLVGGHSIEGNELALGFTVNGLAPPAQLSRKAGLEPGDVLILSKPIGTGVLFAAEMRGKAKARWIDDAIEAMTRGCGPAARILGRHQVSAMTDVTGFGLIGHLGELLVASGTDATLDANAVPTLAGALEALEMGIESSISPQNMQRAATLLAAPDGWPKLQLRLMVDPQTAGGLLAGVPSARADACLAALRGGGDDAAIIGTVIARQTTTAMIHQS
jgi:selenide, water dikinase